MKTIQNNVATNQTENSARAALREKLKRLAESPPIVPPSGQSVNFTDALEITLREDKELLERLAQ